MTEQEIQARVDAGIAYFKQGYNCSQSVALALCDLYDIPKPLMTKLSASFGGGIGRMREVCGACSGMFLMAGMETATIEANKEAKRRNYELVQHLAAEFKKVTGSIICRELLGLDKKDIGSPVPEQRTAEYYKKRPCPFMIETGIRTYLTWLSTASCQQ